MIHEVRLGGRERQLYSLPQLAQDQGIALEQVPYSGRVLMESALAAGRGDQAAELGRRLSNGEEPDSELTFRPGRLLVQDYTGIPLLVDLAILRDRVRHPERVNPAIPVDVVVDHSVQVDWSGRHDARLRNEALEMSRNRERYEFLKWAESAFDRIRVIPPGSGIVHQVNLEQLATVVRADREGVLRPDTVIGTDSHTTMVNGLGVLGWGVGGLEAESILLGLDQPITVPSVVGVRLTGRLRDGVTATDAALTLTQQLRRFQVQGSIVEFTGAGVTGLPAADRCTIANMAPEYGAMAAYFPVDQETLRYLGLTGRTDQAVDLIEAYCRYQQLFSGTGEPVFHRTVELDLDTVRPSLAGPSRPDQRISISQLPLSFTQAHPVLARTTKDLSDGDIVIAALTSCTSTSNPRAMFAAGLLARRAVERGLSVPAHVKTSLSPGSHAVTRYLQDAGLMPYLEQLGFHVTGYGCMTCNGGSGPLAPDLEKLITDEGLAVCAVLSGNRNFGSRIHTLVKAAYLASPALVVALALAGNVRVDLESEPIGMTAGGTAVHLADLWPSEAELAELEATHLAPAMFSIEPATRSAEVSAGLAAGTDAWHQIPFPRGPVFEWNKQSTYIRPPTYVDAAIPVESLGPARALVVLGDDVSTDHISPVGQISPDSPAGSYLRERGTDELNSFGSRRGNHEVMARGTFTNPQLGNQLLSTEIAEGKTLHLPTGDVVTVHEAAQRYAKTATPLVVLAGKNYGMGSSRDWAAKGPWMLGVRIVLAESYERIHRANLCAMGILPLLFPADRSWAELGLTGHEEFTFVGLAQAAGTGTVEVGTDGARNFTARADVRSPAEWESLQAGGALPRLLGRLLAEETA